MAAPKKKARKKIPNDLEPQCIALTKAGTRCTQHSGIHNLCLQHYRMTVGHGNSKKIKTIYEKEART